MKIINSYPLQLQAGSLLADPDVIYYGWRDLQIKRSKPTGPPPAPTASQTAWRAIQPLAIASWSAISSQARADWELLASQRLLQTPYGNWRRAGYQQFLSSYMTAKVGGFTVPPLPISSPTPDIAIEFISAKWADIPLLQLTFVPLQIGFTGLKFIFYAAGPFPSIGRKPKSSEWRLLVPFNLGNSWVIRENDDPITFDAENLWTDLDGKVGQFCWFRILPIINPSNRGLAIEGQLVLEDL